MRASRRFGVLSDQYIRENYADCFLPIRVDKLHSIRQRPAKSFVNTSGKRVKEYNSIAPVIPQFIAENNSMDQNQLNAIKSDLIRTSANAKSDLNILQPQRKRQGTLQEDIGFTKISSMANAQDPNFGRIDKKFVSDELEDQAPLAAYGDVVEYNTLRGQTASRHKEDMSFSGKGVKAELAQILDPNVSNQLFLAGEFKNVPQSPLFAKPDPKAARPRKKQQPSNLFPGQQNAQGAPGPPGPSAPPPGDETGGGGAFEPPPEPPPPTGSPSGVGAGVGFGYDPSIHKFEYKYGSVHRGEEDPAEFKGSINSKSALVKFLNEGLIMEGKSAVSKKDYLKSLDINNLRAILYEFFPAR